MEKGLVSIIIPVYNSEKYLKKCLNSIIDQTYNNIEIICINDGSTDNSLSLLEEYKKTDKRIVIIDKKNNGVSSARNDGIKKSNGEFITFVDSDDWLEKNAIENMVNLIKKHKCEVVRTNYYINKDNSNESVKNNINFNELYKKDKINEDLLEKFLLGELNCYTVLLMIRSDILKNNKIYFNESIGMLEDKLFYIDLLLKINSIYLSDDTYTYHYYQNVNGASLSLKNIERNINNIVEVNSIILNTLKDNNKLLSKVNTFHIGLLIYYFYSLYITSDINKKEFISKIEKAFNKKDIIKYYDAKYISKENLIQYKLILNKNYNVLFIFYKIKKNLKLLKAYFRGE